MWLLVVMLAWPLVEISLFVVIGGQIGLWATLAWVFLSAVLGVLVMRLTALKGAMRMQDGLRMVRLGPQEMATGLWGMLAGGLLILPGFATDALGLLLLLPPVQAGLTALMARRMMPQGAPGQAEPDIVDAEWEEIKPDAPRLGRGPSGWTNGQDTRH